MCQHKAMKFENLNEDTLQSKYLEYKFWLTIVNSIRRIQVQDIQSHTQQEEAQIQVQRGHQSLEAMDQHSMLEDHLLYKRMGVVEEAIYNFHLF